MLKRLLCDVRGNFAVMTGLAALPLVLVIGFAVDGARWYATQTYLQNAADMTSLALAASSEQDATKLRASADRFLAANLTDKPVRNVKIVSLDVNAEQIKMRVTGDIASLFMGIARYDVLPTSAYVEAKRAPIRKVEIALVLDNTFSMEDPSISPTKIATLKIAATNLIDSLLPAQDDTVRIGIVPYADYVNVGTKYRTAPWISVPADYSTTSQKTCKDITSKTVCDKREPNYPCSSNVDGVIIAGTCTGKCTQSHDEPVVPPTQSCSGGVTTNYTWYGCVGSRMSGTTRLNEQYPSITYPGRLDSKKLCPAEITTLNSDKAGLKQKITALYTSIGSSYRPLTYIPAGLIWGQNMLSPDTPLEDADPYDPDNKSPRKVLVLMTDGENTLKFRSSDGAHVSFSTNATTAQAEFTNVNTETKTICAYSKSKKIEIFTVAFMVDDVAAKSMLQECASDNAHYFDASNTAKLISAFDGIAKQISQVRIAE